MVATLLAPDLLKIVAKTARLEVSVHIRGGTNRTDMRSLAFATGLESSGHTVTYRSRGERSQGDDLVVQTGFARSEAILGAIEQEVPYLIMEAPVFRDFYDINKASNFTYNGLAGGGTRPIPGTEPRPHPPLHQGYGEGTLIIGQKPTDHSLRGADHIQWIKDKLVEYPDAAFRHHPLMVMPGDQVSLDAALANAGRVVTWNSTAGVDALFAGCRVIVEGPGSEVRPGEPRVEAAHRLSWSTFTHDELVSLPVVHTILEGYEEAEANAKAGLQEIPRERVNGRAVCQRYYRAF